jgi:hypothetical protein
MSYNVMTFQCLGLHLERAVAFRPNKKGQFIDAFITSAGQRPSP